MKLPKELLELYLQAGERKAQAERRIGTIHLESKRFLKLAEEDYDKQMAQLDRFVQAGLHALGLPFNAPDRHFFVAADGTVKELVNGEYVEPRGHETTS